MYYIDTNILIYVNDIESPFHDSASDVFYRALDQNKAIINEIVLTEFFAIVTDSRKMAFPWSTSQAKHYIKALLEAARELHFINLDIISDACINLERCGIKRYNVYDHLIAYSMNYYGIEKIITYNRKDFERYDFIKEIVSPTS